MESGINLLQSYRTLTCCVCHIAFAMTEKFYNQKLKDKTYFHCPQGHSQYFTGQSEEEKLKDEITRLEKKVEFVKSCKRRIEYQKRHWKGEVTKIKKELGG